MDVTYILILLLAGSIITYFSGDTLAARVALFFSVAALAGSVMLLSLFNAGEAIGYSKLWVAKPQIYLAFQGDGFSLAMLLFTTALVPLIIYSSFGSIIQNARSFYALVVFMAFAMAGTFLAADG